MLWLLLFLGTDPLVAKHLHEHDLPSAPAPFGLLAGMQWGQTEAQLNKRYGKLLTQSGNIRGPIAWATRHGTPNGAADGFIIYFMTPQPKAPAALAQAWGPPTECTPDGSDHRKNGQRNSVWHNRKDHVRAWLQFTDGAKGGLLVRQYWPTEAAIEFARKRAPIGKTLRQLRRKHPKAWEKDDDELEMPTPEWGTGRTDVRFKLDKKKRVRGYRFTLDHDLCRERRWTILEAFEAALGPAKLTVDNDGWLYTFPKDAQIRIRPTYGLGSSAGWQVEVGDVR